VTSRPLEGRDASRGNHPPSQRAGGSSEDTPPVGTAGRRVTFAKRPLRKIFRAPADPPPVGWAACLIPPVYWAGGTHFSKYSQPQPFFQILIFLILFKKTPHIYIHHKMCFCFQEEINVLFYLLSNRNFHMENGYFFLFSHFCCRGIVLCDPSYSFFLFFLCLCCGGLYYVCLVHFAPSLSSGCLCKRPATESSGEVAHWSMGWVVSKYF
jgi:hypothetical protein